MDALLLILDLFWRFFVIGLTTFGGGAAMIPVIQDLIVEKGGFISNDLFMQVIAVAESTPGPIAVNTATFVGNHALMSLTGNSFLGIIGGITSTLAVVLPSFIIIYLIAALGTKIIKSKGVQMAFLGLNPAVIGLIGAVGVNIALDSTFKKPDDAEVNFSFEWFDWRALFIIVILVCFYTLSPRGKKPILIILLSAFLGYMLYGVFNKEILGY
ncbi:chromate transporter [Acholeplasma sp. OttesenSCG-928-E16]|nr:chromate transporter [Acholeplasma sp. OttesenSCG-928-E16]